MSLAFLLTSLVIVATPGTGALYTIGAGLSRGTRASVIAAAGCTLGIVPHLVAAVTGTAALLRASGLAFEVVKVLGVAYLLYMAWACLGRARQSSGVAPVLQLAQRAGLQAPPRPPRVAVLAGPGLLLRFSSTCVHGPL